MSKQRFYIDTLGNDDQAYKEAMSFACNLADKDSQIKRVILLISTKQHTGWFERLFKQEIVNQLFKGKQFNNCKPIFKFETKKNYKNTSPSSEIVITCGLNEEDIFPIDDFSSVKAIIVIPWLREKIQKWVQTWNPIELRGTESNSLPYPEPSCIIKRAMEVLTRSINLTEGLSHTLDINLVKTFIRALHKYESSLDSNVVGAYLIKELEWQTKDAKKIENLIVSLNTGGFFQGGETEGLQNYYKEWKKKCNEL